MRPSSIVEHHCQWVFRGYVLAGLKAGCFPLQTELGSYTSPKTPLNMCICKLCNDVTEDLEHFLSHCLALTELRNDFFCCVQTLLNRDFLLYTLPEKLSTSMTIHPLHCSWNLQYVYFQTKPKLTVQYFALSTESLNDVCFDMQLSFLFYVGTYPSCTQSSFCLAVLYSN